jgi:membrane protein DedA with SNARE-associated domain
VSQVSNAVETLLAWLASAPAAAIYASLGLAAALENVFPPIPADVVVFFGGVLAGGSAVDLWAVFGTVWAANVAGALLVYGLGRRYGQAFFAGAIGKRLLRPHQLTQLDVFYREHGPRVIFISRFLPMFRALVPVFAGVSNLGFWRTFLPMAAASGLWYGSIVYLGGAAGRNWRQILEMISQAGRGLAVAAGLLALLVAWWWWRSR